MMVNRITETIDQTIARLDHDIMLKQQDVTRLIEEMLTAAAVRGELDAIRRKSQDGSPG